MEMSSTFSGTFFRKIPEQLFRKPEFSGTLFRNVPQFQNNVLDISGVRKKIVPEFRISGIFSIMEMEKILESFPYVNRNPEFRWKPYLQPVSYFKKVSSS